MSMQACAVRVTVFSTGGKFPVSPIFYSDVHSSYFTYKLQRTHTQSHTHRYKQYYLLFQWPTYQ